MEAPISHNMLEELQDFINNQDVSIFKLTNSDLQVKRDGEKVAEDLTFNVKKERGFDYIEIDNDWDNIREYVMKLDKYGEPLLEEKPVPLIENLTFNEGENYVIGKVEVVATNITAQYLALGDSLVTPNIIDISDGFLIDEQALQDRKLNVMLTDKIFTSGYLTDEFGGNLIRLDFVIAQVGLKPYNSDMFAWQSLYNTEKAICVAKSIDNALRDIEVVPTSKSRNVIHTVFLKTQSYK
jgi:hypothetical protein